MLLSERSESEENLVLGVIPATPTSENSKTIKTVSISGFQELRVGGSNESYIIDDFYGITLSGRYFMIP